MRFLSFAKMSAALAVVATVLAACVVVEEGPGPRPPRPDRPPEMCTREYAPVCGERRGERQTFGNACMARADGFRIVGQGECRRERPPQQQTACPMIYQPVCGERRGERRTFGNSCSAGAEGFRVVGQGECRGDGRPGGGRPGDGRPGDGRPGDGGGRPGAGGPGGGNQQVACPMIFDPVCARRGNDQRTFGNSCEANSANYRVVRAGSC
ncbi:hypothetical protein FY036_22895 [Mesorhizobium microcysteis]|jgi:hypothetical protein|uniref:Kazal-like domain-containing protein n=1 Tax=Neoaquamicrobium microcysteis TaxID=2682781 RepID=A0A5D4GQU4_9HYPH|nr:Kazal-type serine protease inhibitor [Mesorhizobium microcysteis]TYR29695.1 hypothetical protein FY036_22895 [Mesorhizobium microcysteis]